MRCASQSPADITAGTPRSPRTARDCGCSARQRGLPEIFPISRTHGLRPVQWRGRGRGRSAASCGLWQSLPWGLPFPQVRAGGAGPPPPAAPAKIPSRVNPLRIHCHREDFLDFSPPSLPVDLDPAQFTVKSSEPSVGVHALPHRSSGSRASGYLRSGRPDFLVPLSQIHTWEHLPRRSA